MKRPLLPATIVLVVTAFLSLPSVSSASYIVGRNAQKPVLQVDAQGHGLVSFTAEGKQQHVMVWGAVNALPPTRGRQQTAFQVDYSGGYGALKIANYYKTIKSVCKPYNGPPLAWYVKGSGCLAPDGSYWALQSWQRMLPNLGFKPWKPEQAVWELHVSHWTGPLAKLEVWTDWAWGGRFHQIVGSFTYLDKPVYGFGSTTVGVPTDAWGRNNYLDSFAAPYGPGWSRENSFLAQSPKGGFCYSFGPRPPYPGYPASPPRQGNGSRYRFTTLGPGVTPAVSIEVPDPGEWDANNPAKVEQENKANQIVAALGFTPSLCHS